MRLSVLTSLWLWRSWWRTSTITRSTNRSRSAHWSSWRLPLRYNKLGWRLRSELRRNHIGRCLSRERWSVDWPRTCYLYRTGSRAQVVSRWNGRRWSSTRNWCLRLNTRWKLRQTRFSFFCDRRPWLHTWRTLMGCRCFRNVSLWLNSSHRYSWLLCGNNNTLRLSFWLRLRWRALLCRSCASRECNRSILMRLRLCCRHLCLLLLLRQCFWHTKILFLLLAGSDIRKYAKYGVANLVGL